MSRRLLSAVALLAAASACGRPGARGAAPAVAHDPRDPAQLSAAGGRLSVRFAAAHGRLRAAELLADGRTVPMHVQLADGARDVWRGTLPEGVTRYAIRARSAAGTREAGPYAVPETLFRAVPWVGASVGYQIFPDRFANGDTTNDHFALETDEHPLLDAALRGAPPGLSRWDGPVGASHCCHQYFGGDLRGVLDRLDYLRSLGVTLVWLNPIWLAGSAHGYDTWDYQRVDPALGDEALLDTLVRQARARGIRLMWDFVPNHVGVGHPAFRDAVARGTASPYWGWFDFRVPRERIRVGDASGYATFAGAGALPKLRTGQPAVREHLLAAVRRWTSFGFAGIRVDVPEEVEDGETFFRAVRRAAKAADPDVYLVGEIWRSAPEWVRGDRFDALMNYAIGQDVIERFATGRIAGDSALRAMARLYAAYPEAAAAMAFNVVATHDNARLLTKMGGGELGATPGAEALARQRLASAMLFALPGVPVTFQGDECAFLGTGGGGSGERNRYPMQWASCDRSMVAHYRRLARLRGELAALRTPAIRLEHGEGAVLAWRRGEPGAGEVLAVFNAAPTSGTLALPAGDWTDTAEGRRYRGRVPLDAFGWRWLLRRR